MSLRIRKALTFDDVLLVPQKSNILPSAANLQTKLTQKISLQIPLVSAAMDTVTEAKMAIAIAKAGGIGIIHKNLSVEEQTTQVKLVKQNGNNLLVGAAVGIGANYMDRVAALVDACIDVVVVDTAHGHSKNVINALEEIKKKYTGLEVIAGNIATARAAERLISAGADALKVGMGPGSICTTRIVSGIGVPQLTAIDDVVSVAKFKNIPVIADGGIKYSGDIVKALAVGASTVMIGSLFAGTDETPGETFTENGKTYKKYRGMGSLSAMQAGSKDRYFQCDVKESKKLVPEGVDGRVDYKGSVDDIIYQLLGGLRSGMGYMGAATIADLQQRAEFVEISSSGIRESHVHDVTITTTAPNYRP